MFDTVNPWTEVAKLKKPPYLAKCDKDIKLASFYNLRTEVLPQPYLGDVDSAKVICLLLNPGYSETEGGIELTCHGLQQELRRNLSSTNSRLVYLDDEFDWTSGGKWLREKVLKPLSHGGVTRDDLNRNFAIVEYFPYHSKFFDVKENKPLQSQQFGFDLVRQAIKNNAIILLMRGEKLWLEAVPELEAYRQSGNCVVPHSTRNVVLSEANLGEKNFARVVEVLKMGSSNAAVLERNFRELIIERGKFCQFDKYLEENSDFEFPHVTEDLLGWENSKHITIPGLLGGFDYFLEERDGKMVLYAEQSSRMDNSSDDYLYFEITEDENRMLEGEELEIVREKFSQASRKAREEHLRKVRQLRGA